MTRQAVARQQDSTDLVDLLLSVGVNFSESGIAQHLGDDHVEVRQHVAPRKELF